MIRLIAKPSLASGSLLPKSLTDSTLCTSVFVLSARQKHDLTQHVSPFPKFYHPRPLRPIPPVPKDYKEFPERDVVNFPHYEHMLMPSKIRMFVFPESWFKFMEKKAGVLGPYSLVVGFLAFLIQKEIVVMDAEMLIPIHASILLYLGNRYFGPGFTKFAADKLDAAYEARYVERDNELKSANEGIQAEHFFQQCKQVMLANLFEAKLENVALQLEDAYRKRLRSVHSQVKQQLDYLCDVEEVKRRLQHAHMVNWVVNQVRKSITPELEKATMQQCLVDLKTLAGRH